MSEGYWFTLKIKVKSIREQGFSLQVISAKREDWSKAQIVNILTWKPKMN